jgi:hypothetical protein
MVEQQNIFEATTFSLSLFGQRQSGERCVFEKHQAFYFAALLWEPFLDKDIWRLPQQY